MGTDARQAMPPRDARHRVRQAAGRAAYDRDTLYAVLDACPIGHVAFVDSGLPVSIPTAIARLDDRLYMHGSRSSRLYRLMASGASVSVSVCRLDGYVKARSAFHCSMNYRSAVVFGTPERVASRDAPVLLERFTERLIPGSADDFRPALAKELKATALVSMTLDSASVKIRKGDPIDDDEDLDLPHWAGVLPIREVSDPPRPARDLAAGIEPPPRLRAPSPD